MTVNVMGVGLTVEFGFGHGPAESDAGISWTDCSDWVRTSPGIGITRGRSVESTSVSVGTMSLTLDNLDGRFDSENLTGPYFGQLIDGTPVRISTIVDGTTETIFRGWVETWPLVDQNVDSVVDLTCSDIFGLLARGKGPATAFDAAVRSIGIPPDHWWRPGPTGYEDQVTGATMDHYGALVGQDPIVNGDENTWGQPEPDGLGRTEDRIAEVLDGGVYDYTIVSAWVRLAPLTERPIVPALGYPEPVRIIEVAASYIGGYLGVTARMLLVVEHDGVRWRYTTKHGRQEWVTAQLDGIGAILMDGRPHHIVVAGRPEFAVQGTPPPNVGGQGWLWIDGREIGVDVGMDSGPFGPSGATYTFRSATIGAGLNTPYQGVIDHIVTWDAYPGSDDNEADWSTLNSLAASLFDAGRYGWAGQPLDERASSIVTAMGAGDRIGVFDTSGIVTLQSYRQGDVLKLLQEAEDTEQGRIWVDRHGDIRYSNRQWAWAATESTVVQARFSDVDDGNIPMLASGLVAGRDARRVINVAQVTSTFGRMQTVRDEQSIALRGERSIHLSGLLHRSDSESAAIAEWLLRSRSTPSTRVDQISFNASESIDAGRIAQRIDETWLIEVIRRERTFAGHVTQIRHSINESGWVVTLALDSTRTDTTWFRWNDSEWDNTDNEGWSF